MTRKHEFPAGKYYIGDPCYVVPEDKWMSLLDETGFFGLPKLVPTGFFDDGVFLYNGKKCFATSTKYGDGSYEIRNDYDEYIDSVMVDSGSIAIMPIDALENPAVAWIDIKQSFIVYEDNGIFYFGEFIIDTANDEEDDEYYGDSNDSDY